MASVMKDVIFSVANTLLKNNKNNQETLWNPKLVLEFEELSKFFISSVIVFELFVLRATQAGMPERRSFIKKPWYHSTT